MREIRIIMRNKIVTTIIVMKMVIIVRIRNEKIIKLMNGAILLQCLTVVKLHRTLYVDKQKCSFTVHYTLSDGDVVGAPSN